MTTSEAVILPIGLGSATTLLDPAIAGAKAAHLSHMACLGLPVPAAFVLPTSLCAPINAGDKGAIRLVRSSLAAGIRQLEAATGLRLGDTRRPLLISVRSGAALSMPGMLETLLDVGINREVVLGLMRATGDPRLAWDSYRRFLATYGEVVLGLPSKAFETALCELLAEEDAASDTDLDSEALERLSKTYRDLLVALSGRPVPDDPMEQLEQAALAVYRSWVSPKATAYRRLHGLDQSSGTAVLVQTMVFGNSGSRSGSGVAFTRNPATGARELYVDYLPDAQGEDVVSGRRSLATAADLNKRLPQAFFALQEAAHRLEQTFADAQDIEFTIEHGTLWLLQTRPAKRTPLAAARIAVDLASDGTITIADALERTKAIDLDALSERSFAGSAAAIALGTPAAGGVAYGRVAFDSARAVAMSKTGEPVVLVRPDTSTEDVEGFAAAVAFLTAVGGRTAHAAVVARDMGKVAIVGCRALSFDADNRSARLGDARLAEGDWISLDGDTGEIFSGRRDIDQGRLDPAAATLKGWQQKAHVAKPKSNTRPTTRGTRRPAAP